MDREGKISATPAKGERRVFLGAAVLLVLALLIGGQANGNALREMLVQMVAVFVAGSAYLASRTAQDPAITASKWVITAMVALVVLHLVPLPYSLWASLNPVDTAKEVLAGLGLANGWRPFALDPAEAFDNLLLLLPPVAIFYAVLQLSPYFRTRLALIACIMAAISAAVGLLQYGSGTQSLAFYDKTHLGFGTGFFSNRNHQADLAIIGWLLAAVLVSSPVLPTARKSGAVQGGVVLLATALFVLAILATGSRGGFLLAGFAGLAVLVIRFTGSAGKLFAALIGAGVLAAAGLAVAASSGSTLLGATVERFGNDEEARLVIWPRVLELLGDVMPLGTGIGSFTEVYRFTEPLGMVGRKYVNSAHNEFLEIALEAGIPGLAILFAGIAVIFWAGWRALKGGLGAAGDGRRLKAAAGVAIIILIAHSSFDYPLRTTGLAVLFAFLCGLLMPRPDDSTKT